MTGDLPEDFLRVPGSSNPQQQQMMSDAQVAQILQSQQSQSQVGFAPVPANMAGKMSISIVQVRFTNTFEHF